MVFSLLPDNYGSALAEVKAHRAAHKHLAAENAALKEQVAQLEAEATKWKEACRKEYLSAIDWAGKTQAAEIDLDTLQSKSAALVDALERIRSDLWLQIESKHGPKFATNYPSILTADAALAAFKG